ncbi:MAG: hypothetical protein B6U69_04045 [Thermofilum sp. ex4484_15]|nr:MAG: hypothetical protein B6U69_04045 [Thermofilum sp. ex4484_15]
MVYKRLITALRYTCNYLIDNGYYLHTASEAKCLIFHFLLNEGVKDVEIHVDHVPNLKGSKYSSDMVLKEGGKVVLVKVKVLAKGMRSREAKERIWGRRDRNVIDYVSRMVKVASKFKGDEVKLVMVIFDEKGYLRLEQVMDLRRALKRFNDFNILYYDLRELRERKLKGGSSRLGALSERILLPLSLLRKERNFTGVCRT